MLHIYKLRPYSQTLDQAGSLERFAKDKCSTLLRTFVNCGHKRFNDAGPSSLLREPCCQVLKVQCCKTFLQRNLQFAIVNCNSPSHRDRTRASTLCFLFLIFFSSFEHVKSLLIMGPNNTKNSPFKCNFLTINYE